MMFCLKVFKMDTECVFFLIFLFPSFKILLQLVQITVIPDNLLVWQEKEPRTGWGETRWLSDRVGCKILHLDFSL